VTFTPAQELLLLMQQLLLALELLGALLDLLFGLADLLAELIEFGNHGNVVDHLLAVAMGLLQSQRLIDGAEVRLLVGPAIEVEVSCLHRGPFALLQQRAGTEVGHRSFGAALNLHHAYAKELFRVVRVIEVHQASAYPVAVSVGSVVGPVENPLPLQQRRFEAGDPRSSWRPCL
jgi:hypothetical protein